MLALCDARDVLSTSVTRPTTVDKIWFHFRRFRDLPPALAASYVFERMCTLARGFEKQLWWIAYELCREMRKPLPVALRNRSYSLSAALRLYRPRLYLGRIAHFWALDRPSGSLSQLKREWHDVSRGSGDISRGRRRPQYDLGSSQRVYHGADSSRPAYFRSRKSRATSRTARCSPSTS